MNRILFIVVNIFTGLFVLINSVVGYGISGMGEDSTPNIAILGLIVIWAVGLALQLSKRIRVLGFIITFIPVMFILYMYFTAMNI
ncbi:hypothetical protein CSV80_05975 [Sporosarcina sp. P12(2017)]|uniref:hypothetical protein n=1 Tax=unclassified Sporosarcina TaxID=2647733 RepID=UPI000C169BE9|nr:MULTISPECIES: hypothetical protein [unclassified Sporosarcina]PIC57856.1 hypothetical protein CSV81_06120 [Sporosarcina sp. P10]PIC61238.1 hypothetical protein CSV80_05975 [Sporosarcina sp. P12(2017)]